ncbi:MAG: EAL domain-containing protein [Chloroflexota bacterium]|nr:MAG: EAL domain-containing protein [Chloroflexota bacterium]
MIDLGMDQASLSPRSLRALQRISSILAGATIVIGTAAIAGWLVGIPLATSWLPWLSPVRPNAALIAAALGVAFVLATRPGSRARLLAQVVAAGALALAVATVAEWLAGRDLGFDNLFWPASMEGPSELASERMSLGSAIGFACLAVAVVARADGLHLARFVEPAAVMTSLFSAFGLVTIVMGADPEFAVVGSRVSVPGATAAGLLAVAVLISRPEHRLVQVLLDPGPAARSTRGILPAVAGFPIAAFLVLKAYESGAMTPAVAAVAASIFGVAYAAWLLARGAHGVGELVREAVAAREARDRFFDLTGDIVVIVGPDGVIRYVSAAAQTALGYAPASVVGRAYADFFPQEEHDRRVATFTRLLRSDEGHRHVERRIRHADGSWRWIEWATNRDPGSGALYAVGRDVTELREQRDGRERLAAVIEQSNETVVLSDAAGTVVYANSAFERASGRSAAEVVGLPARALGRGPQEPSILMEIGRAMAAGEAWQGEWTELRPDNSTRTEMVRITPIRDAAGTVSNWVYVGNDVTDHRAAQAAFEREVQERADVVAALARLDLSGPLDSTAADICGELMALPGVDYAAVVAFGRRQGEVIASAGLVDPDLTAGAIVPADATHRLRTRAEHGPWTYVLTPNLRRATHDPLVAAGIRMLACAPLRNGTDVIGIVRIGTLRADLNEEMIRLLPAVSEFAAAAGGALGPALAARTADATVRAKVRAWIDGETFSTVFQPIVDLSSRDIAGYEALSRFEDGTRPDLAFAEAHAAGLGLDLEIATLRTALRSALDLPAGIPLDVNVSPALLLEGVRLAEVLSGRDRPIVLEITEHDRIDDYGAVRHAIQELGPDIRLAVDDAGAGAANMIHLVELRPDLVKLDISLVRGINIDPTRQALVVGLRHFATTARCRLVAEGIESSAEATTLAAFGIEYGQGFWLGRPASAAALAEMPATVTRPGGLASRPRARVQDSDSASLIA